MREFHNHKCACGRLFDCSYEILHLTRCPDRSPNHDRQRARRIIAEVLADKPHIRDLFTDMLKEGIVT